MQRIFKSANPFRPSPAWMTFSYILLGVWTLIVLFPLYWLLIETFRQLTGNHRAGLDVIVRFLAVLELYKRGMVDLRQATTFGELEIGWVGPTEADAADLSTAELYD